MAKKSSFDAEARKRAIDKHMPEDKPNPILKTIKKGITKFREATTPPEELAALKKIKAKKTEAKGEARAEERTKELDERIKKSSDKAEKTYKKRADPKDDLDITGEQEGLWRRLRKSKGSQSQRKKEGDARIAELKKEQGN